MHQHCPTACRQAYFLKPCVYYLLFVYYAGFACRHCSINRTADFVAACFIFTVFAVAWRMFKSVYCNHLFLYGKYV
ncbi:hypothetical protein C7N43_10335 [Sphingobacteriales bacterium UPWRP_1]|nr:hypothetical protein C7N43_10335 [Sphingobacteriales bacterium UPWRP_1]